jgi:hypothetical protein
MIVLRMSLGNKTVKAIPSNLSSCGHIRMLSRNMFRWRTLKNLPRMASHPRVGPSATHTLMRSWSASTGSTKQNASAPSFSTRALQDHRGRRIRDRRLGRWVQQPQASLKSWLRPTGRVRARPPRNPRPRAGYPHRTGRKPGAAHSGESTPQFHQTDSEKPKAHQNHQHAQDGSKPAKSREGHARSLCQVTPAMYWLGR